MRVRPSVLVLGAAVVGLVAPLSASAEVVPTLKSSSVFFHCNGTTKVANASVQETGKVPGWNATKPTASFTTGAGCGWVDPGALRATAYNANAGDAIFTGTHTGNLDSLTLKVHNLFVGPGRQSNKAITTRVSLRIDGVEYFTPDSTAPGRGTVTVDPVMSSTGATGEYQVTVRGIGLKTEDGDGTQVRTVDVIIGTTEQMNGWLYDATEVASGIDFNPATPAKAVLTATPPAPTEE